MSLSVLQAHQEDGNGVTAGNQSESDVIKCQCEIKSEIQAVGQKQEANEKVELRNALLNGFWQPSSYSRQVSVSWQTWSKCVRNGYAGRPVITKRRVCA